MNWLKVLFNKVISIFRRFKTPQDVQKEVLATPVPAPTQSTLLGPSRGLQIDFNSSARTTHPLGNNMSNVFLYGEQPSGWTKGPVTVVYNPKSPVLSQATGTFAMGSNDEVRWVKDSGNDFFQMEIRSPVYTRQQVLEENTNLGTKRAKLADHGYEPMTDEEILKYT